jgi:hypothetical protein
MAFEYPVAFRYSKVSRHYSLPIGKPSIWVANPVIALQVRYLYPDYVKYLHLPLSGSPALLCSCCTPRSHVGVGRALSVQAMES